MPAHLKWICLFFALVACNSKNANAEDSGEVDSDELDDDSSNGTVPQDLYVIKTVVYEVGILTDASNDTDANDTESNEQVNLSIYNPTHNGTAIDLSSIPLPIQTNVSGVEVTGVLPSNLGTLLRPANGSNVQLNTLPVLPNKQIKVTQNISTTNPEKGGEIISNLSKLLGLHSPLVKIPPNNTTNGRDDK